MLDPAEETWIDLVHGLSLPSKAMDSIVNVHEAKTHLSELLRRVEGGEEIVVARAGKPVARLVPAAATPRRRVGGQLKGQVWISPDFDDPLPPEIQRYFE
jgi:prevent-host-death family protein